MLQVISRHAWVQLTDKTLSTISLPKPNQPISQLSLRYSLNVLPREPQKLPHEMKAIAPKERLLQPLGILHPHPRRPKRALVQRRLRIPRQSIFPLLLGRLPQNLRDLGVGKQLSLDESVVQDRGHGDVGLWRDPHRLEERQPGGFEDGLGVGGFDVAKCALWLRVCQ